jgi:hypothetical protein
VISDKWGVENKALRAEMIIEKMNVNLGRGG